MSPKHIRFASPTFSMESVCPPRKFPRSPIPSSASDSIPKAAPTVSIAVSKPLFGLGLGDVVGSSATITVGSPPAVFSRSSGSLTGLGISFLPFSLIPPAFPDGTPLTGEFAAFEHPSSRLPNPYSSIGLGIALFGAALNKPLVGLGFSGFDIPQSISTIDDYVRHSSPTPASQSIQCHSANIPRNSKFLKSPRIFPMFRSLSVGATTLSAPFEDPFLKQAIEFPSSWTVTMPPWVSDMSPSPWLYPHGLTTPVFIEE